MLANILLKSSGFYYFKGHQRMVCSTAWGEETNAKASCNLFSCGFDRRVLGWQVREEKDK